MSWVHQNFVLTVTPAFGGIEFPKAGHIKVHLERVLGLSPMPHGVMVHMMVEGKPAPTSLLLPTGSVRAADREAPTWAFACVQDEQGMPENFGMDNFVGSVAIPPGLGLHVYMRKVG
jgi:hypothetical protein